MVLCEKGAVAGVDVRGGGPATRETDLLNPKNMVEQIHAVTLAGGSAFGLDASGGVMSYLESKGIGFDVGVTKVPIVCQSSIFDLTVGSMKKRPNFDMAVKACEKYARLCGYEDAEVSSYAITLDAIQNIEKKLQYTKIGRASCRERV